MRINGHAHIFNLQTVLTEEAIRVLIDRLERYGFPAYVRDAVTELLSEQLDHPEYLSEDELLARLVAAMADSADFPRLPGVDVDLRSLTGSTDGVGVRALKDVLNRLAAYAPQSGKAKKAFDIIETLRVAMQPDIPRVAGKLLSHLGPDDAIVALMMDITAPDEPERDRVNFRRQIHGTVDAVLAYPGRVLPFFAVNPRRDRDDDHHFELLRHGVQEQGFFGVKLYPSLGYEVETEAMERVLAYCVEKDLPITIHTSAGGFFKSQATAQYSHPEHWADLLAAYPDLRICFAHCGGWGGLCGQVDHEAEWADRILAFTADYPNVHADISYHVQQMEDPATEDAYFDALADHLDGDLGDRIIFGTDSWLLRLDMDDELYWKYFERKLGDAHFEKVATTNPRRFFGIEPARENARRHVAWLDAHAGEVGATPARWVRDFDRGDADEPAWVVVRRDAGWSVNNWAHRIAFSYLREQLPGRWRDDDFPHAGPIRLRQLDYFVREAGGPSDTIVEGKALELLAVCTDWGRPEADHDQGSIYDAFVELLSDPNRTVAEVGRAIDAMFLFQPETSP